MLFKPLQISLLTFQNHFLGIEEGYDDDFDPHFWENTTFQSQSLPSLASFNTAFPSRHLPAYNTATKMYMSIGGDVYRLKYAGPASNTCAIRVTKALNYSGVNIPNIPEKVPSRVL